MRRLSLASGHTFSEPTRITLEASNDVIIEQGLNTLLGEQYDTLDAVISITVEPGEITITTVRTHAAWKRAEPNAGRGEWTFPRSSISSIYVPE